MRPVRAAALALAFLVLTPAAPAMAHGDTAAFTAVQAEPNADGSYTVDVLLTYDDGDAVEGAAVTVTAVGADFGPAPIPMTAGDRPGAYTGVVAFNTGGEYTLTAASADPAATRTFTVTASDPTPTTVAPTTSSSPATASTPTTAPPDDGGGGGSGAALWVNLGLLVVGAGAAFLAIRWWRGRSPT